MVMSQNTLFDLGNDYQVMVNHQLTAEVKERLVGVDKQKH
jgi:hypothetical protein